MTTPCPSCADHGYRVFADGEWASAEVCSCKRDCKVCKGERFVIAKDGLYDVATPCECSPLFGRVRTYVDAKIPAGYAEKRLTPLGPDDLMGFADRGIDSLKRAKNAVNRYRVALDSTNSQGLVLMGGFGLGKTHLVCGLISYLTLHRGIGCRFVDYYQLLAKIRSTFDRDKSGDRTTDTEQSLIDPLVEVPVLVIDDLGKGQGSNWELSILDQIVTRRYNARRIILATTNYLTEAELEKGHQAPKRGRRLNESLEERIGERLVSRLFASCDMILLDGPDYRIVGPRGARGPSGAR